MVVVARNTLEDHTAGQNDLTVQEEE
jgi:hypothetical protein